MQRFQGLKTTSGRGRPRHGVGNQTQGERHLHGDSGRLGETEGGVTGCPDAAQRGFVASRRLCFRLVFHPSPRTRQHPGRDAARGREERRLVCETPATRRAWNPGTLAEQTPWGGRVSQTHLGVDTGPRLPRRGRPLWVTRQSGCGHLTPHWLLGVRKPF